MAENAASPPTAPAQLEEKRMQTTRQLESILKRAELLFSLNKEEPIEWSDEVNYLIFQVGPDKTYEVFVTVNFGGDMITYHVEREESDGGDFETSPSPIEIPMADFFHIDDLLAYIWSLPTVMRIAESLLSEDDRVLEEQFQQDPDYECDPDYAPKGDK